MSDESFDISVKEPIKEKQNLRYDAKWLYISLKTPHGVQANSSDNCIDL